MSEKSFFAELRRRKVFQSAAIYGAVAWGVTEVVVTVVEHLFLPQWVATLAVIGFVVGFPIAMFLAWTFDLTSEGIRRTGVTRRQGTASLVASGVLLVAGTAALFMLIRPGLQTAERERAAPELPPNSVAVLPFDSAGVPPEDAYLVNGLGDELRDQLARVRGLRIAARSSSVAVSSRGLDAQSMAATLGVARWVEGNVRRQGNTFRISVQLIDGNNGLALWSETFERGHEELLHVQQSITEAVVRHVLPETDTIVAEPATRIPTANEYLLRARQLEQTVRERLEIDEAALLEAVQLYRWATEADPSSALAFSRLAGALIFLGDLDAAEAPIFKALSLAPNLSEIHVTRGDFHWARGDVEEAGVAWRRAVELNPNNPEALYSLANWRWINIETEGIAELYRRALELDPLNVERYGSLGVYLAFENHYEEAEQLAKRMAEMTEGPAAFRAIATVYEQLGQTDRAIAWTLRARDAEPDNPYHVAQLADYYADLGDFDTALALDPEGIGVHYKMRRFQETIDLAEMAMLDHPEDIRLRVVLAVSYNAVGEHESALHVLRSMGLPDSVFRGWRSLADIDALQTLQNTFYGMGEIETAVALTQWSVDNIGYTNSHSWWVSVSEACDRSVLGQDELARAALRRARLGRMLPWEPQLRDLPCLQRFKDDPEFVQTLEYFDRLRAAVRQRLPATLQEYGVSL